MHMHEPRKGLGRFLAAVTVVALALGACSGAGSGSKGTVNIAVNPWVGYESDAAVVAYLLDKELGYKVAKKDLKEEVSWQGCESGEVDVVLENWGHPELVKTYITDKKVALDAGQTGNKGIIGWYVPQWMADKYPDILDWNNLNKYADLFKTSESGDKGQLLDGDPSYVTNDEALVTNLKLNYKVVQGGSEAALIKSLQQATDQKTPLLFYFYEPQWILAKVKIAHVKLPPYTDGCDADPKKVACDYPPYDLNKVVSKKFADSGGKAYEFVKNFNWTNDDQNTVSEMIANQGMKPEDAAKTWVDAHQDVWKKWIPAG